MCHFYLFIFLILVIVSEMKIDVGLIIGLFSVEFRENKKRNRVILRDF